MPTALECALPPGASAIETLRGQLQQLTREEWEREPALRTAAEALCTLVVGLESAPAPRPSESLTNTIRQQAALLADPDQSPFSRSGRVRAGLDAAVIALEELASAQRIEAAGPWLRSARRSVALVDADGLFALQRAAIQDAFRTVSAAFAIVIGALDKSATRGVSTQPVAAH